MALAVSDHVDFEEFVAARGQALVRFAYVLTGDRGQAEDLVQEALAKTHRRWTRAEHPEAYVRRAIVNQATSWRRRRHFRPQLDVGSATTPDVADGVIERDAVWRALAGLPPRQRAVLTLRYYEDQTDEQIATILDCALPTVRSLAHRACDRLRAEPGLRGTTAETRTEQLRP